MIPVPGFIQQSDLGLVKVQVPQSMDVADFVTTHFTTIATHGSTACTRTPLGSRAVPADPAGGSRSSISGLRMTGAALYR